MTARMRISTLALDPMNPRLVDEPGPDDQQNIIMRLWRHHKLPRLAADILEGMYLGPPAMLAVRQEGRTVVIDGNRRLAALLACHNHRIWDLAARESSMTGNAQPRQGDPEEEIIMFDSRDEAMRARIRRQTASGSMWSRMAHASHCRNLLMAGMEIPEINRIYGRQRSQTQQNGIHHMVNALNALNALEQVNISVEHPWTRPWHYQALQEALFLPSVRRHLELRAPEEYGPDEPPLREESIPETVELVRVLNGSPLGSKENLPRKIREEQDFWKLGEIYEDPRALEMLKNPQFHNVDQVHSFMSCRNDYHQAKEQAGSPARDGPTRVGQDEGGPGCPGQGSRGHPPGKHDLRGAQRRQRAVPGTTGQPGPPAGRAPEGGHAGVPGGVRPADLPGGAALNQRTQRTALNKLEAR